jgi:hypothetical protein
MSTLVEVDIAKIDEKIARAEADLAMLRMARNLVAEQAKGSRGKSETGKGESGSGESWFSTLPRMFSGGWLTMQQVVDKLEEQGTPVSYSGAYQWMKRAVDRGEFKKRGKKYKFVSGGSGDA